MAIPGMNPREKLTQFIERKIRLESDAMAIYSSKVDQLVRFLEQSLRRQSRFSVSRIVKGGSLGKGTAISEKSDIDLIVFFNGLDNIQDLIDNMGKLLQLLKQTIEESPEFLSRVRYQRETPYSTGFVFEGHEVDLLPAWDVWRQVGYGSANIIYNMMKENPRYARYYSQCLSPLQVSFIRELPAKVKDAIRLIKYWYKIEQVPVTNAYCLELLVVSEWRKFNLQNFNMDQFFKTVLQQLTKCDGLQVSFDDNYNLVNYKVHNVPYIVDPADPFRNTLAGIKVPGVKQKALNTLQRLESM